MDVLEHVPEDGKFLKEAMAKLSPGGIALITVPAWQFLFSDHDRFLEHHRRYNLNRLRETFPAENCETIRFQYFYFSLFLIRALQFFTKQKTSTVTSWSYPEKHFTTRFFVLALHFDYKFCQFLSLVGLKLPGLSCLAVLRKLK